MAGRETLTKGETHVFEVAAGAVQEDDGGRGVVCPYAVIKLDHMLAKTIDIDEAASRQVRPLDQPRANQSNQGAGAEDRDDNS
jgi:hypothetical protein